MHRSLLPVSIRCIHALRRSYFCRHIFELIRSDLSMWHTRDVSIPPYFRLWFELLCPNRCAFDHGTANPKLHLTHTNTNWMAIKSSLLAMCQCVLPAAIITIIIMKWNLHVNATELRSRSRKTSWHTHMQPFPFISLDDRCTLHGLFSCQFRR